MSAQSEMLAHLMRRRKGHTLPRALYIDPDMFDVDMDRIWYRDWILVGSSAEIPKTGNHMTIQIGDYSVIVVRGADGIVRAFHNSCRHRGSRICQAAKGSAPKLVCPYHQWTYDLDGTLQWARDMGPEFDPARHGLKPVHIREAAGILFLSLSPEAPPFDALAAEAQRYAGPHRLADCKLAHETTIVEKANWKLVMENNRECYHCSGSHPSLCVSFDDNPNIAGDGSGKDDPAITAHLAKCEAAGLPSTFTIAPDQQWRFVRVPLLGRAVSYTMDGGQSCEKLVGDVTIRDAGSLLFFHYPNSWNHFLGDVVMLFSMMPIGPQETAVTTKWFVHQDAVEGRDYDLDRLTTVWIHTNDEDRAIVEENQRGINSPAYEPGPYSMLQESGVAQFVDWYCETLTSRLTGRALYAAE
ncbi:aromatic ring-hydroxylating oxygenase subunit alpha [Roseivivax sp. CAU 1753]